MLYGGVDIIYCNIIAKFNNVFFFEILLSAAIIFNI